MKKRLLLFILILQFVFGFSQVTPKSFLSELTDQFPNVRDVSISYNGKEIIFSAQSVMGNLSALVTVSKTEKGWSNPKIASFSGQYFDIEPFFSSDGLRLYYASNRPLEESDSETKDFDIWYVQRKNLNSDWSEPINLGRPINTEFNEFYPAIASNGNIYFTSDNPPLNRKDDIYFSEFTNGKYMQPIPLSDSINSEGYEFNSFIAPDESFLIYSCYQRKDGFGSGDLYISYKTKSGEWSQAENMGKNINSNKMDYCPFVDTKSKIMYFTSKLDNTRTIFKEPIKTSEFIKELNKHDNGSSRLYSVSIKDMISN